MKLTKDKYVISRGTIDIVLIALGNNHSYSIDDEDYNNEDIIVADNLLKAEIKGQEKK